MTFDREVRCDRCGALLQTGYTTLRLTATQEELAGMPDGSGMHSVLAAASACSWNCLAVLAAQRAGQRGDGAVQMIAERERQVTTEDWAPEHDDKHPDGELAAAGCAYGLLHARHGVDLPDDSNEVPALWPWAASAFKAKSLRQDLVRAGALLAAEIDRKTRHDKEPF